MEKIGWVSGDLSFLNDLDEASQHAAVQMVVSSGMKRQEIFSVVREILEHGAPAGRRAAAEALVDFTGTEANGVVLRAIDDSDPQVQAQLVRQLRERGIPGALQRLLAFAESPHEVVRSAARASLPEFRFDRYVASFDMLADDVRRCIGAIINRVDPASTEVLAVELTALARSRRLRGLQMIQAMRIAQQFEEPIIELLADEDHMVRAEAARTLGLCQTAQAVHALNQARADRSVAVQEAAVQSLRILSRQVLDNTTRDRRQESAV